MSHQSLVLPSTASRCYDNLYKKNGLYSMDLAVVFHPPQSGRRIQVSKIVSPRKDPPSRGELVVALERLAVLCISESCMPSSFIDKVDIITSELVLRCLVVCLNTGRDHGDFWGR
jgi:hypothetical protein